MLRVVGSVVMEVCDGCHGEVSTFNFPISHVNFLREWVALSLITQ